MTVTGRSLIVPRVVHTSAAKSMHVEDTIEKQLSLNSLNTFNSKGLSGHVRLELRGTLSEPFSEPVSVVTTDFPALGLRRRRL